MNPDLTFKATIKLQRDINHHMRNTIFEINRLTENSIDWCKKNNKPVGKIMTKIQENCVSELAYLDIQYVKLEEMKNLIDKKQTKVEYF